MEKLGEEQRNNEGASVADKLRAVGASAKLMTAMSNVTQAFDEHIREFGGYEKYYGRLLRIGGVAAAAETIAKTSKKFEDPNSDAVAEQILAQRPEVAEQYKKNVKEAREAIAKANEAQKSGNAAPGAGMGAMAALGTIFQGPGTIALARMPEKSFETWAGLSPEVRKRVRESLRPKKEFGGWFGLFSVNPASLLVTASMAEFQALKEQK
jgi:hypothetical protein